MTADTPISLETVQRLHALTTHLHIPVYFAREAEAEYASEGVSGWSGYFGSRCAAMGELPTESVIATFYNFSSDRVRPAMDGLWEATSAERMELARFRLMTTIFDSVGRQAMTPDSGALSEAIAIMQNVVGRLPWGGRVMAAGNYDALTTLTNSRFGEDELLRLWQLATIVREWRGDAHIAVLTTEPLSPVECTIVTWAQTGSDGVRDSRGWADDAWDAGVAGLIDRGWMTDDSTLSDEGVDRRAAVERRTNELARTIWTGRTDAEVNRLGDLLEPMVDAIIQSGRLKPVGLRPRT